MEYLFRFYVLAAPIMLAVGVVWAPMHHNLASTRRR